MASEDDPTIKHKRNCSHLGKTQIAKLHQRATKHSKVEIEYASSQSTASYSYSLKFEDKRRLKCRQAGALEVVQPVITRLGKAVDYRTYCLEKCPRSTTILFSRISARF